MQTASEYLGGFAPKEEPQEEVAELSEISRGALLEYIERAKEACEGFDGDTMAEIADETSAYA